MTRNRETTYTVVRAVVCATSDKAVCLARNDNDFNKKKGTWFPYSQIKIETDHMRGDWLDVEIADWLLQKQGWDDEIE